MAGQPGHPHAIALRGICKSFDGVTLINNFDLTVAAGESVVLVGPSGSGKTTLLNIISLVDAADSGQVSLCGTNYGADQLGQPKLAYIFQRDALLPWATVEQNILLGIEAVRPVAATDVERAHALLDKVGLGGCESRYPGTLSGGQRQLVAIVQNLLLDPDILLLDEPFSSVDLPTRLMLEREVIDLLEMARRDRARPVTLVMVTHDIEEAIVLGSRVISVGRRHGRPLEIVRDTKVDLSLSERNPVSLRGSKLLRELFLEIYESLAEFAPSQPARIGG